MKKSIFIALFCLGTLSVFAGEPADKSAKEEATKTISVKKKVITSTSITGDVNVDGIVTVADYIALAKYVLGDCEIDETVADVNGDGKINGKDAKAIIPIIESSDYNY